MVFVVFLDNEYITNTEDGFVLRNVSSNSSVVLLEAKEKVWYIGTESGCSFHVAY